MIIQIDDKVIEYMRRKNIESIMVKIKVQSCGWAGDRIIIQGEFIDEKAKKTNFEGYDVKDVNGIRVFIPKHEILKDKKEINIKSGIVIFGRMFLLKVYIKGINDF